MDIKNVVPMPGTVLNWIIPPILSIVCFTKASPRPVPEDLVVKFGVNIFCPKSSGNNRGMIRLLIKNN
jgi:hypothetical protein